MTMTKNYTEISTTRKPALSGLKPADSFYFCVNIRLTAEIVPVGAFKDTWT